MRRLSQGLAAPTRGHMKALRRVMAYLNTVPDMRLHVPRVVGDKWHIYSDSDHAGDTTVGTNRSHTGIVILLNGMPIHWKSNKQPITSYSSACEGTAMISGLSTSPIHFPDFEKINFSI